jgi:hypothetical protein
MNKLNLSLDRCEEKLKNIGVTIKNERGRYRCFDNVMEDIAKVFKDFVNQNKVETDKQTMQNREDIMNNICASLVGETGAIQMTNRYMVKELLINLETK